MRLLLALIFIISTLSAQNYIMLKNKGLYTYWNEYSNETPVGGMTIADNVVIDRKNVVESRRGYEDVYALASTSDRAEKLWFYKEKLFIHTNSDGISYYTGSAWSDYSGTYSVADSNLGRMKTAQANQNLYMCTAAGIKKLDALASSVEDAGVPQALDVTGTLTSNGTGFFESANQVAYRILWGKRDENNNLLIGAPSQRIVVTNTTGVSEDVDLSFTIPSGITTSHFYQIYRSALSGGSAVSPNDELQLVYEDNPSGAEITALSVSVNDNTPDSLRGATLYTSPSQEGISQANYQPPFAKDMAAWRDHLFYANTKTKQNKTVTLLSAGGSGLVADDTITIAGTTFTAKSTESVAQAQFKVYTTGSAAQNIEDTALSLVKVINQYVSNSSTYAYYTSNENELPGKIYVEARSLEYDSFAITSSNGDAFNPVLPTSGTTVSSSNDVCLNCLYWSKTGEQEAVPRVNFQKVGDATEEILRIIPLRDALVILKEDGVFRVSGDSPSNFFIDTIDGTTELIAPDSAVALNNQVYGLTNHGVVAMSDTGVTIISNPIEDVWLDLYGNALSTVKTETFGVGYNTDKKYIIWSVANSGDTYPTQAYVYNFITNAWTRWDISKNHGVVSPVDGKLYLGDADSQYISKERKSYSFRDFVDNAIDVTISAQSSTTITLASVANVEVGDILYESSTVFSAITAVDTVNKQITINDEITFTVGASTVLKAINCDIEYIPQTIGTPGLNKQFSEIEVLFKQKYFYTGQFGFSTDVSPNREYVDVNGIASEVLWGLFEWGSSPWGGYLYPSSIRTYVPSEKQRGGWLKIRIKINSGYNQVAINGYRLRYREYGDKTRF